MACNDDLGRQVTEACKTVDLRVPEEVAVIGVDNDDLVCELSDPPLSSIALNTERGGYEAAELLDRLNSACRFDGSEQLFGDVFKADRASNAAVFIHDNRHMDAARLHLRQ